MIKFNLKNKKNKIIIATLIFGILVGMFSFTVPLKPNDSLDVIIVLLVFPFCSIARCICIRTGMCSIIFNSNDKIVFLIVQAVVYLCIGYLLSMAKSRKKIKPWTRTQEQKDYNRKHNN